MAEKFSATLEIWINGRLVLSKSVITKKEIWEYMRKYPPRTAKGGIVNLVDKKTKVRGGGFKKQNIALSRHGQNGPEWGLV